MTDTRRDDRDLDPQEEPAHLRTGVTVAVRNHFDGAWSDGFEIARSGEGHGPYQVRRCGDRTVLPADFTAEDVRPA